MLHPSDKSISVWMNLVEEKKSISVQFDSDGNFDPSGYLDDPMERVDNAIYIIEKWDKKTWISTAREEVRAFKILLEKHKDAITLKAIKDEMKRLRERMIEDNKKLGSYEMAIAEIVSKPLTEAIDKIVGVQSA